jgi:ribosomal protein S18 acetylase RimI-like enzyme
VALQFVEISQKQDRASFDCGVPPLDEYLKKYAKQNHDKGVSLTFVAIDSTQPKKILGYYSVSSGQIEFESLPIEEKKRLPKYPVPITRIGRLAVDKSTKGKGIGRALLADALNRALTAAKTIGIYAVVVDAKDERAKSFYKKYGFVELKDKPFVLFFPIATVRDSFS